MTQHSNAKSKAPQGRPSGSQPGGNGVKDIAQDQQASESVEDKYLDDQGQPDDNLANCFPPSVMFCIPAAACVFFLAQYFTPS